ncbi:MAG TPA: AGE family epimerase/isomerase [Gemmatimonadaceae bacterium]|nr:AGE family epimerase/isomerase [Gemmatimonadaceae bacterium]
MLGDRIDRFLARSWHRLTPVREESGPASAELRAAVVASAPLLERILMENIVPFWYPRCLDERCGGYLVNHDARGGYKGDSNKRLIIQARIMWFFAHLARSGRMIDEALAAARHGCAFLPKMWDEEHGGFFWESDPCGERPTISHKYVLAHIFPIYALSEYAMVAEDAAALRLASRTFEVLDRRLRDPVHGGYWNRFTADWQTGDLPPTLTRSPHGLKTTEIHLHVLEALTPYVAATNDPLARERLQELLHIQTVRVYRANWGACTDAHRPDWSPLLEPEHAWVNYGHDLENIGVVIAACAVAGVPPETHLDLFRALFRTALRWGYDRRRGGFYRSGPLGQPAYERTKYHWVQAEALSAALEMFSLTGEAQYARCYLRTLDWIVQHHVDWEHGEWHDRPVRRGQPPDDKTGPWKDPFHHGRALLRCLELCGALQAHDVA